MSPFVGRSYALRSPHRGIAEIPPLHHPELAFGRARGRFFMRARGLSRSSFAGYAEDYAMFSTPCCYIVLGGVFRRYAIRIDGRDVNAYVLRLIQ